MYKLINCLVLGAGVPDQPGHVQHGPRGRGGARGRRGSAAVGRDVAQRGGAAAGRGAGLQEDGPRVQVSDKNSNCYLFGLFKYYVIRFIDSV